MAYETNVEEDITELLKGWGRGDNQALDQLMTAVYGELRSRAELLFHKEAENHTLQPTALVSELFIKLRNQRKTQWCNREQFFGVSATLMRRVLVDYARHRLAKKRGANVPKIPLDEILGLAETKDTELIALDEALSALGKMDRRAARVVELKIFGGLNRKEIAAAMGIGTSTVNRDWGVARLFLRRELTRHSGAAEKKSS